MDGLDVTPTTVYPTSGCAYVARVSFDHGDRTFAPGDAFPFAALGMHEFTAYGLWQAGMLAVAAPASTVSDAEMERLTAPSFPPPGKPFKRR